MKKVFGLLIALGLLSAGAWAVDIKPIFLTTHNDNGSVLPILLKKGRTLDGGGTEVGSWLDGTRTMDEYFGLRRYDSDHLLLGVFSNGINEKDASDNQTLAAQYPDRSLIWIDAKTGKPEGVALVIGFKPAEPTVEYKTAYGSDLPFFLAFDVSDEGYIYVAFGEYILRYKPDGKGGFTSPETVFQLSDIATNGAEDWGINAFSVNGAGKNTQIFGGQNGKGFALTTADGNQFTLAFTYTRAGWPGISGPQSNLVHNATMKEEWIFVGGYGNASAGNDSSFYRLTRALNNPTEIFVNDDSFFTAAGKTDATDAEYKANYIGGIGGADGLPYVVAYSTPSWDSSIKVSPAFIALHDITAYELYGEADGAYIADIQIPVYSNEELRLPTGTTSDWYGTEGTVEVNIPAGADAGAFEILWGGGIYGYGRFSVGNINEPVGLSDWQLF